MDFVVIGLGLSALALLTGLTLLCLVAPRWFRKAGVAHPGDAAHARAQAGERHALGQGFLCVGAVLLLTTLGGISAGLADKAGAYLIATMTTLAMLGLFGWDLLYRRQHPIPQRRRVARARPQPEATEEPASLLAVAAASPAGPTTTVRRRVLPARQRVIPASRPETAAAASPVVAAADAATAGDDQRQVVITEPASGPVETDAQAVAEPVPEPDAQAPGAEPGASEDAAPDPAGELASGESTETGPAAPADALAEPVPFPPVPSNGNADHATPAPEPEPELLPNGDDRVIALFPTAAARRSRTIAAPTDPDDQS